MSHLLVNEPFDERPYRCCSDPITELRLVSSRVGLSNVRIAYISRFLQSVHSISPLRSVQTRSLKQFFSSKTGYIFYRIRKKNSTVVSRQQFFKTDLSHAENYFFFQCKMYVVKSENTLQVEHVKQGAHQFLKQEQLSTMCLQGLCSMYTERRIVTTVEFYSCLWYISTYLHIHRRVQQIVLHVITIKYKYLLSLQTLKPQIIFNYSLKLYPSTLAKSPCFPRQYYFLPVDRTSNQCSDPSYHAIEAASLERDSELGGTIQRRTLSLRRRKLVDLLLANDNGSIRAPPAPICVVLKHVSCSHKQHEWRARIRENGRVHGLW